MMGSVLDRVMGQGWVFGRMNNRSLEGFKGSRNFHKRILENTGE